jgi:uncharacterized membrane protein
MLQILENAMMWLGYGLCHQLPERSFFGGAYQVPVCARDTGIYLGFVVSLWLVAVASRGTKPSELPPWPVLALAAAFVGVMALDGITSYANLRTTTNDVRLVTGLLAGWALPALVVPMLNGQLWRVPGRRRALDNSRDVWLWLAGIPVTFAVARWLLPLTGILFPVLVSVAIIVTFVTVNLVIVTIAPPLERKAERLRDAWPAILAALLLTCFEVALSAGLRVLLVRLTEGVR